MESGCDLWCHSFFNMSTTYSTTRSDWLHLYCYIYTEQIPQSLVFPYQLLLIKKFLHTRASSTHNSSCLIHSWQVLIPLSPLMSSTPSLRPVIRWLEVLGAPLRARRFSHGIRSGRANSTMSWSTIMQNLTRGMRSLRARRLIMFGSSFFCLLLKEGCQILIFILQVAHIAAPLVDNPGNTDYDRDFLKPAVEG